MRERSLLVVGAVSALLVPAALALAAPPGSTPVRVGVEARPSIVTWGTAGGIGGHVSGPRTPAGTAVVLEADTVPFDGFLPSATSAIDASGDYGFRVSPTANTRYRVTVRTAPPAQSAEVLMYVRMRVSLRVSDASPTRGQRVRFYGSVTPAHVGLVVRIQKRNADGTFRNVARATLTAGSSASSSRFTGAIPIFANGVYRVLAPSHDDHVKALSALRVLRVS